MDGKCPTDTTKTIKTTDTPDIPHVIPISYYFY